MEFQAHRPHPQLGRPERPLGRIATELTHFLTTAQRSLTVAPLQLARRHREAVAQLGVEFAAALYQAIRRRYPRLTIGDE